MYFICAYPPTKTCQPPTQGLSHISGYHTSPSHTSTVPDTPHTLPSPLHVHADHTHMYTIPCLISSHDHLAQALTPATSHTELILQACSYRPHIPRQETPPTPARTLSPRPGSIMRVTLTARGGKAGGSLPGVRAPFLEVRSPWGTRRRVGTGKG